MNQQSRDTSNTVHIHQQQQQQHQQQQQQHQQQPSQQQQHLSMTQMTCIKRPQHNSKLTAALNSLLECGSLIDVTIYCDDGQINAHRLVLAASSTYFRNLFNRMPPTLQYPIIVLREVSIVDLKNIIQFIYYGEVNVPQNQVDSLMRCTEYLQIDGMASSTNSLNAVLASASSTSTSSSTSSTHTNATSTSTPTNLQQSALTTETATTTNSNKNLLTSPLDFYAATGTALTTTSNQTNNSGGNNSLTLVNNQRTLVELQNGTVKFRPHGSSLTNSNNAAVNNSNNSRRYAGLTTRRRNHQHNNNRSLEFANSNSPLVFSSNGGNNQLDNLTFATDLSDGIFTMTNNIDSSKLYSQATSSRNQNSNQAAGLIDADGFRTSSKQQSRANSGGGGKLKFECQTCHKFFTHGFTLKRHMKLHSQRPLIYCDTCSKSYSCRDSFLRHKKSTGHMSHSQFDRSLEIDVNINNK